MIKEKYPSAQVTVSLGLPCKGPKIYNKIEVANAMIKERIFRVPGISLCDNSNLSYRCRPARGMLGEDGVHISRQGVFAMNNNIRSCVYYFGGESEPRRFQSRGGNISLSEKYLQDNSLETRISQDKVIDAMGRDLLDFCVESQMRILNGRTFGDT